MKITNPVFKTDPGIRIISSSHFSKKALVAFALIFAGFGIYVLFRTFAAPPANFTNTTPITGLTEPTNILFTPDNRMLILGRRGTIWVAQPGATQVDATPFLQLPNGRVLLDGEQGLLGFTLDPNFSTNGFYYIYYTDSSTNRARLSRLTAVGNTTNVNTEATIWQMPDTVSLYHHGGTLAFGPDNKLYLSIGDHTTPTSAQSLTSAKGKIIRINSDGSIPTDNPFYDGAGPNRDEIWAYGFRNPFRFSFDSVSGKLYEGDVGENSWEEVNIVTRGANYGWPTCEGTCGTAGMTNPTYRYDHNTGSAITGGFVYRGTQFPVGYRGAYFFGDYTGHYMRYLTLDANGSSVGVNYFDPTTNSFGSESNQGNPVAMTMGPDGSIYYVDIGPFQTNNTGKIHKLTYTAANQSPTVQSSANPTSSNAAPLTVNFSSAGTTDPENQTLTYSWVFGDGGTSTQANPSHAYNARGVYNARLTVSDGTNIVTGNVIKITVGRPPVPVISTPANNLSFVAGQQINFSGSASDPEDGALAGSSLNWSVVFHHEQHIHPTAALNGVSSGSFTIPTSGHDFTGNTSYEITLTATDVDGISASTSVFVNPQKVNVTMSTNPSGGDIVVDDLNHTTPYTFDSLVGFTHTLNAQSPINIGPSSYTFSSWADGGAQTHDIIVPSTNQTYTANYQFNPTITIGETNVASDDDSGNANLLPAQQATLSQTATIQSMSFYATAAAGNLRLGIYDATGSGGNPGAKKAETAEFTPTVGWNTANVITPVSLPAGTYWLAYAPSDNGLAFKINRSTGTHRTASRTYGPLPATFPTSFNTIAGQWSFYATLSLSAPTSGPSDINTDGTVNITDLSLLLSSFGQSTTQCITNVSYKCDLSTPSDNLVNIFDLSILLTKWGTAG